MGGALGFGGAWTRNGGAQGDFDLGQQGQQLATTRRPTGHTDGTHRHTCKEIDGMGGRHKQPSPLMING